MKKLLLLSLLLFAIGPLCAQVNLNDFDGIKSQGPIPQDLRLTLDELFAQDKQRARDFNDGKLKNRDKVLMSSFYINKLTASGRVLYGDPLSLMLNRIADTLMKDYPDLRKNIHIYVLKSPEVNAFITGQGMLFVTTGLIAQVENEAQLAFVISHEVIHFYKDHSWESITTQYKNGTGSEEEKAQQELRNFVKYHNRSHAMENEADSLGIVMFYGASPYDKRVADGFFDVLQYGYLPFDEITLDTNYFDTKYYHFSQDFFLDSVAPISARDDYDDSKSTHPNLLKRRERCSDLLASLGSAPSQMFVTISKEEFLQLRDLARLECIRQNLIYAEYVRALYDIMVMQRYLPDNPYLIKAKAMAYYGVSKFRNNAGSNEFLGDYKLVEGEAQQAYYFFRKVKKEELNMLAVRELWKAHRLMPQDQIVTRMTQDAMKELASKSAFSHISFSEVLDTASQVDNATTQQPAQSKYDRIKQKKRKQAVVDMKRFFFTDLMEQDKSFKPYMDSCMLHASDSAVSNAKVKDSTNMLVYASQYFVVGRDRLKIQESDSKEGKLTDYLAAAAKREGMGIVDFSDQGLRGFTTDQQYNDFVTVNEYVNEFWQSKGDFQRQLSLQPEMNDLSNRYNADYINLTQVVNLEGLSRGGMHFWYVWFPVFWPMLFSNLSYGYENTFVQSLYVDAATGELLSGRRYEYELADNKALVAGSIYDNMQCAKGKKNSSFMGRHLLVGVDFILGLNQTAGNSGFMGFSSELGREDLFQLRPRVNLEYIFNNNYAIHASASQSKTTFKEVWEKTHSYSDGYSRTSTEYIRLPHDIYSFSLGFRRYGDLAPHGTFWGVSLLWHTTKLDLAENPNPKVGALNERMNKIGCNFEFGRNYIFFDRLVLNIGMNVGLVGSLPIHPKEFLFETTDKPLLWTDKFEFGRKLWLQNIFTFNIGLGVLPF